MQEYRTQHLSHHTKTSEPARNTRKTRLQYQKGETDKKTQVNGPRTTRGQGNNKGTTRGINKTGETKQDNKQTNNWEQMRGGDTGTQNRSTRQG